MLRSSLLDPGLQPAASCPASEGSTTLASEEHRYVLRRVRDNPMWTLDRGTGFYDMERRTKKKASLLGSGKDAGKSRVMYHGVEWSRILRHVWRRDFFTTAVHARFLYIVAAMVGVFISSFLFWACIYYVIWKVDGSCFLGFHSFLSAFLFSIETQNTIGYGSHAIGDCWLPAWLVGIQCILAVLLEAVFIGVIFAKISHPKGRSRTILISECACIARRGGILKLMFRVADIRKRTAIAPKIHAVLYTWGPGHTTAEGELIPVGVTPLPLHYLDATLLLPVVVEHTIDERSPLYGHTSESLEAVGAEIVVTFEGTSELGDSFMSRQSYLPSEVHWGCTFVNIIQQAGQGHTQHSINLSRFHDVEPQPGLALMPPHRLSRAVVLGGARRIPRPRLGENTLLLADELVVTQGADGRWFVAVRVGDAYPSQMCCASVTMFIYRYSTSSSGGPSAEAAADGAAAAAAVCQTQTYSHQELPLTRHLWSDAAGPQQQQQQQQQQQADSVVATAASSAAAAAMTRAKSGVSVLLRYPVVVGHEIGPDSPLKDWITPEGMLQDADAEIVVVASATQYITSHLAMRSKVYSVLGSIRWGHCYAPCVVPPKRSLTGHALVEWAKFHDTAAVHPSARRAGSSRRMPPGQQQQQQEQQHTADAYEAQVADVLEQLSAHQLHAQQQHAHAQQQQQQQQHAVPIGLLQDRLAQAAAAAGDADSYGETGSRGATWKQQQQQQQRGGEQGRLAAAGSSAVQQGLLTQQRSSASRQESASSTAAVPIVQQQSQGELEEEDWDAYLAHSVGFADLHDMGQLHAKLKQQQQHVRQAVTSAAGLRQTTSAEGAAVEGSGSSSIGWQQQQQQQQQLLASGAADPRGGSLSSSARRTRATQQQQQQLQQRQQQEAEDEDAHTLTVMPARVNSWADKRSLAGVLDLFESAGSAEQQQQPAAASAAWFDSNGAGAAGQGGGQGSSSKDKQ
uniref:Inward rectifier potassium channel C-terminal domain-containing protein n=1 Tax=Tetradesmus obliquus TaxID=3088 RepID=A0A383WNJ7_TETOB|eukprot:jgi/Sobl393_1/5239/SZX79038.1